MRLGIISDVHDNLWNLKVALEGLNKQADVLLCCGDLCSPFVVDELKRFHGPVHIIFGNNDADLFRITRKASGNVTAHGELFTADLSGKRIAANHFDYIARPMAQSGLYDLVCFGHNHRISQQTFGKTLALNPGPIMGVALNADGWEEVDPTYLVCDLTKMSVEQFVARGR